MSSNQPARQGTPANKDTEPSKTKGSKDLAKDLTSGELVFGIVGHVGSGTSTVAGALGELLENVQVNGKQQINTLIKARTVIGEWAENNGRDCPDTSESMIDIVTAYQNLGDDMRSSNKDHAAVARGAILRIRERRAELQGDQLSGDEPVVPNGEPRSFVIDSIRHPAEVALLRRVYGEAFVLVGVVCEKSAREIRIRDKYSTAGKDEAEAFMERDAKAKEKHGQRVSDAFHLSDFFIDNSATRFLDSAGKKSNPNWDINDHLNRLIKLVTHDAIERPKNEETAMYAAAGAAMSSSCLSRQVGAALTDREGNVLATGANEVPKAHGGVYGEELPRGMEDGRCFRQNKYCSNSKEQKVMAEAIATDISEFLTKDPNDPDLVEAIRLSRVGELLEFSRAVHAEMDALLAAGRKGTTTVGSRLYVTTFPCHYCARHIVAAGVTEVQFIEPYPKSKAFDLHGDSISNGDPTSLIPGNDEADLKVVFRPFKGVAPRMYRRAFQKDRELKNKATGDMDVHSPDWGSPFDASKSSYAEFEVTLTKGFAV